MSAICLSAVFISSSVSGPRPRRRFRFCSPERIWESAVGRTRVEARLTASFQPLTRWIAKLVSSGQAPPDRLRKERAHDRPDGLGGRFPGELRLDLLGEDRAVVAAPELGAGLGLE